MFAGICVERILSNSARGLLVVDLGNCFIGLTALASFTFFVSQWLRLPAADPKFAGFCRFSGSFRCRTGLAYALFLWGTIEMMGLALVIIHPIFVLPRWCT